MDEQKIDELLDAYTKVVKECPKCKDQKVPGDCKTCRGFGALPNSLGFDLLRLIEMSSLMSWNPQKFHFEWNDDNEVVTIL